MGLKPVAFEVEKTRNDVVSVDNNSTLISAATKRVVYHIKNISANADEVITLHFGSQPAIATYGVVLNPGDSCTDSNSEGYLCYQGDIYAICAVAGPGSLAVFER